MQKNLFTATALMAFLTVPAALGHETGQSGGDQGKRMIERPIERSLQPSSAMPFSSLGGSLKKGFVNPKVEPGKVAWHRDYKEAVAASRHSGKPVLLFQMMGKLDDNFC